MVDGVYQEVVMTEAHYAPYSDHPEGDKMYQDIKEMFW